MVVDVPSQSVSETALVSSAGVFPRRYGYFNREPKPAGNIVWIGKRRIVRIVRVQMSTADSYRKLAAELKAKAVRERNATLASEYEQLARAYLRLAEQADRNERFDLHLEFGPGPRLKNSGA